MDFTPESALPTSTGTPAPDPGTGSSSYIDWLNAWLASVGGELSTTASVSTDKADYAPGSIATITASGFAAGASITFAIADLPSSPGSDGDADVYAPFTVTDGGAGDLDGLANGTVVTTWGLPTSNNGTGTGLPDALNATLVLTASGSDGQLAATSFTDANPVPVQFFYVPFPEDQLLTGLQAIENGGGGDTPISPVTTYISIAAVANNTIIYYDQWENGYDADIANPLNLYSGSNLGGTQIWGDGNIANGAAPGVTTNAGDAINAGTVIILKNDINTSNLTAIDFDGRDKIATTKNIAVTKTSWAAGSNTLLAGSVEVFDTNNWGTDYRAPVGVNIPDGTDFQMFQYTSLYIMAGAGGAVVNFDNNNDGDYTDAGEFQNIALAEGQTRFINGGVNAGARVTSTGGPVQVDILTGDIASSYESRDSGLLPVNLWSSSYYTPVSTTSSAQTLSGTDTTVWLYNPGASSITVQYETRNGSGNLTTVSLTVPGGASGGYLKQVLPAGYGAHFYTTGATPAKFYAFSTTDSNNSTTSGAGTVNDPTQYDGNQAWDWGFSLIPQDSLTPQVLIGLGIGRDPNNTTNSLTQNGNPVWVTPIGNGNTAVDVYVDFDANPLTGTLTDPNGNKYDLTLSLRELDQAKVFDTVDRDQTGTLIYTLGRTTANPSVTIADVKLAAAWGQDPLTASPGAPGLDVGTGVVPLPLFSAGKNATLATDNDGDGFISPGDVLLYTISIPNISRAPVSDLLLKDFLPADVTYVAGSTFFKNASGVTTAVTDDGTGTPFPLDGSGKVLDPITALPVGGTYQVTFQVIIDTFPNLTPGTTQLVNTGTATADGTTVPFSSTTPLYGKIGDFVWYDIDGDGVQDGGAETGFSGVTLNLIKDNNINGIIDGGDTTIATATTNASGLYLFTGVLAGNYLVDVVTAPAGTVLTTGSVDPKPVALAGGQTFLTADFGYRYNGSIAGNVKEDIDNNNTGDVNLSGVTISLFSGSTVVATTTTNASGNYSFTGLAGGNYTVQQTNLPGYVDVSDTQGANDSLIAVTLPASGNSTGNNFVDERLGSISGNVKEDIDNNNTGDVNLSGVTISLLSGTTIVATTTTDASGNYSFTGVENGSYTVQQTNLPGYLDVSDSDGGDPNSIAVTISAGSSSTGNDFIDRNLPTFDLQITKDNGLTEVIAGQLVTYTIVVKNTGPVEATGVTVKDIFPTSLPKLTGISWTSTVTGGASGNEVSGTGDIHDSGITMPFGSTITYTVTGTVVAPAPLTRTQDFKSTSNNPVTGPSVTLNGVKADAFYDDKATTGVFEYNVATTLWRRNSTSDKGLGVISPGESTSSSVDDNELSNQRNNEIIRLTKTDDQEQWTSVWVSSLDGGGSGNKERGTIYWSDVATPDLTTLTTKFEFQFGDFGTKVEGDLLKLAKSAPLDRSAKYLFFVSGPNPQGTNNDYLVWKTSTAKVTPGSLTNTASVTPATNPPDTDPANNSDTDSDILIGAPGTRLPIFWASTTGRTFWDGISGNELRPGPNTANFPVDDLLTAPYSNASSPGQALDPVTGTYQTGLLLGDFNRNGKTDAGEDTLFYTTAQALQILNVTPSESGLDKRYLVAKPLVASWLNYLAGNPVDLTSGTDARDYIDEGIDWLQALTPDQTGDKKGDGQLRNLIGNVTPPGSPVSTINTSYTKTFASAAALPAGYTSNTGVDFGLLSGSTIQTNLDAYNNGTGRANGVFFGGVA